MKLSKHQNHRNLDYLSWLREQPCIISGDNAQCAHHVRLGTNGGSGIKPSDYFCIPLLNEHHTTGASALHIIGEESFFSKYELDRNKLFIKYLTDYISNKYNETYQQDLEDESFLSNIIEIVELKRPKTRERIKTPSKAKLAKKLQDKGLRKQVKESRPAPPKIQFKGNDYYEKAKEFKREQDKALRDKLKQSSNSDSESFYEKAKASKKAYEKEMRSKNKKKKNSYKTDYYAKLKELNDS